MVISGAPNGFTARGAINLRGARITARPSSGRTGHLMPTPGAGDHPWIGSGGRRESSKRHDPGTAGHQRMHSLGSRGGRGCAFRLRPEHLARHDRWPGELTPPQAGRRGFCGRLLPWPAVTWRLKGLPRYRAWFGSDLQCRLWRVIGGGEMLLACLWLRDRGVGAG